MTSSMIEPSVSVFQSLFTPAVLRSIRFVKVPLFILVFAAHLAPLDFDQCSKLSPLKWLAFTNIQNFRDQINFIPIWYNN
jgi:hypothetical protein